MVRWFYNTIGLDARVHAHDSNPTLLLHLLRLVLHLRYLIWGCEASIIESVLREVLVL